MMIMMPGKTRVNVLWSLGGPFILAVVYRDQVFPGIIIIIIIIIKFYVDFLIVIFFNEYKL